MSFPIPRPVSEGSKLAIVAPAGPFDEDAFQLGVNWLRLRYEVEHSEEIFSREGFLAGSDQRRLDELTSAVEDPSVDAILCARGGYGATRLLPGLDLPLITEANKLIVGFSDITALHSIWARAGVRSIHAPMVASLGGASDEIRNGWIQSLEQPDLPRHWALERINPEAPSATGTFLGGNLAVLGALNGTEYIPPVDDAILFIEDVGERPYRIDRMLTSLTQSGWFDRLNGVVIGAFTESDPGPDGVTLDDIFESYFSQAPFPVLRGLPAGHIDHNEALSFGSNASIINDTLLVNH